MITQEEVRPPAGQVETPAPPPAAAGEAGSARAGEGRTPGPIERISGEVGRVVRRIRESGVGRTAKRKAIEARDRVVDATRRKPAAGLGAIAACGFVAGMILRRSFRSGARRACK